MTKLAFVDTETTGLDPDLHEIWEVGLIVREPVAVPETSGVTELVQEVEHHWYLPVDLGRADPVALSIGGYHERFESSPMGSGFRTAATPLRTFAAEFACLTYGAHLVGAVVSFDAERLWKLLKANGACPEWHYHLVDVEALAAGDDGTPPPWDSKDLSRALGVDPDDYEVHTALGDARWARDLYDAVFDEKESA